MGIQSVSNSGLGRRNVKRSLEGVTGISFSVTTALVLGGYTANFSNVIDSYIIETSGNAVDFGDLSLARSAGGAASSSTRAVLGGGVSQSGSPGNNTIDYVTVANAGNATDFGDLTVARSSVAGVSNTTRAVFGGGLSGTSPSVNTAAMDYITIASTGNATSFGNLTVSRTDTSDSGCGSSTRGLYAGGYNHANQTFRNEIDYITIASTGNATDFGDLAAGTYNVAGASSSTRALFAGGGTQASGLVNTINYVTVATTGNVTSFGTLLNLKRCGGTSSSIRASFAGGDTPGDVKMNNIEQVTIATTGNAVDHGDLTVARASVSTSNGHGGLQ